MNLVIDIGNSSAKYAVFDERKLIANKSVKEITGETMQQLLISFPSINQAIICSVTKGGKFEKIVKDFISTTVVLNESTILPIKNCYKTPDTLGYDRLAGVIGATVLKPSSNLLVIDVGTAITYDLLDEKSQYIGGNISPGLIMRFRALHDYTERLPLLSPSDDYVLVADNTTCAIISGVQHGIIFEIDAYIDELRKRSNSLSVFLTGGDCFFFEKKIKNPIFVEPTLVLIGLNEILLHNHR